MSKVGGEGCLWIKKLGKTAHKIKDVNQFAGDAIHPLGHVIHAAQHQVHIEDHQPEAMA